MGALLPPPTRPFRAAIAALDDVTLAAMRGRSWQDDPRCPPPDQLALITAAHQTLDGGLAEGRLVVARALAGHAVTLLGRLYAIGFPIASLRPIAEHDGDDHASMEADNSSGFNFRTIAGTEVLSQHAYGRAIDLNPVENPMVWPDGRVVPPAGAAFVDRRRLRPGMIVRPGPVTAILDELGWEWGGDWRHVADHHHLVWSRPLP